MLCVRGCRGRDWQVLPCVEVLGRVCVHFSMRASWLQHCLGVRWSNATWLCVMRNLMAECKSAFKSCHATDKHNEPGQHPPGRKRILDSDDESALPFSPPTGFEPRAPTRFEPRGGTSGPTRNRRPQQPRSRRSKRCEFVTAMVRGMKLTFTVLRGRGVYVPVEGPWLQQIIEHVARESSQQGFEPSPDFMALLHKCDRPHIGWLPARLGVKDHGSWCIRCRRQDGMTRMFSAGFRVPRMDSSGGTYSASDALHAARQALHRAKMCWNKRDVSGLARFDV